MGAYATAALDYLDAGWIPLPLPPRQKADPPSGCTGRYEDATRSDVEAWIASKGDGELCIRLDPCTIGIDVDAHKGGTLDALIEQLGPLPPTYFSTSRSDGSGIFLFAIPNGVRLIDRPVPRVEIIQHHHRYVIAWPSIHRDTGEVYHWHDETSGEILEAPPDHDCIPDLPTAWLEYLARTSPTSISTPAGSDEIVAFIERNTASHRPERLDQLMTRLTDDCGRHATLQPIAIRAMCEAAEGDYPAGEAIERMAEWWQRRMNTPADRDRADLGPGSEFQRMIALGVGAAAPTETLENAVAASIEIAKPQTLTADSGRPFGLLTVGEIAAEVDAMPPAQWLWRRVWAAEDYGVVSASWKVGKTFIALDAAVSISAGTAWLSTFEAELTGTVVVFAGEGGKRKFTRRGRAIAAHYGVEWDALPIHLAERVPKMGDAHQLQQLAAVVAELRPALVIIDPFYLAVGGDADSTKLAQMGDRLEPVQRICQASGSALMFMHHHKRDKTAKGSDAMSGAGPAEWGRVLISAERKHSSVDVVTQQSDVHIALTIEGDDVAGGEYRFRRRVWADDPDDRSSPMHYIVEPIDAEPITSAGGLAPSRSRVLDALTALGDWRSKHEIGDYLANDGRGSPLKQRTILEACAELVGLGLIDSRQDSAGEARTWRVFDEEYLCNLI
jgi:hypothetical protein